MPGTIGIVNQVLNRLKRLAASAMPGDLDGDVADGSILGHVMASSDVSNFNRTQHSLQAIAAAILAASTELAKVPKSDGTVSWNTTALAAIQTACETALTTIGINRAEYEEFSDSTSSSTYVTAVSVTGSGRLYALTAGGADVGIRVTIDGIEHESTPGTYGWMSLGSGNIQLSSSSGSSPVAGYVIEFKNSLLIEYKSTSTSTLKVAYGHDT